MEHVTDRRSNPFGMSPPCRHRCTPDGPAGVHGYGDANADFHVIGDHSGVHGGVQTGIPFTGTEGGAELRRVLADVDLLADATDPEPDYVNCFTSYLHLCCPEPGTEPDHDDYRELERFFDAELRAINAHILLPVGTRATDRVLRGYSTQRHRITLDMSALHAAQIRGRGFLIVPIADPAEWTDDEADTLRGTLQALLASDYRQTKGVATLVG